MPQDIINELILYIKPYRQIFLALPCRLPYRKNPVFAEKYCRIHHGMSLTKRGEIKEMIGDYANGFCDSFLRIKNDDDAFFLRIRKEMIDHYFNNSKYHLKDFLLYKIALLIPWEDPDPPDIDFKKAEWPFMVAMIGQEILRKKRSIFLLAIAENLKAIFFYLLNFFGFDVELIDTGNVRKILEKYPEIASYNTRIK